MIHKFTSQIGDETDVDVEFDYQPEEKQLGLFPGCPEVCIIHSVTISGDEIMHELDPGTIQRLTNEVYNYVKEQKQENDDGE